MRNTSNLFGFKNSVIHAVVALLLYLSNEKSKIRRVYQQVGR